MGWYLILHNIFLGKMFSSTNKMLISKIFAKKEINWGKRMMIEGEQNG